jgi:putative redox protein
LGALQQKPMEIQLKRLDESFWLEASNEGGNKIHVDAAPEIGGSGKGFRPMQLLLAGLGGCSAIDVISILRKQKQILADISVTVTGERQKGVVPSVFTDAHIHFVFTGELDEEKVRKAVSLSVEKYCSVARTLEKTARITHSFEIVTHE